MSLCKIDGCDRETVNELRGWCGVHYNRWRRHGDPCAGKTVRGHPLKFLKETAASFASDDCLLWPYGRGKDGRGSVSYEGRIQYASRLVCQFVHGEPSAPDLVAAHSCGNGHLSCVNPRHLRWATTQENNAETADHGRTIAGEKNHFAKLTAEQATQIKNLKGTASQREIATRFCVTQGAVSRIHSGKSWRAA